MDIFICSEYISVLIGEYMKDNKLTELLLTACSGGLADYFKSGFNKLDLSKVKTITCKRRDDIYNLEWLISKHAFGNQKIELKHVKHHRPNVYWQKWTYNEKGLRTHYKDSDGSWQRWKYNEKGLKTYYIGSPLNGFWKRWEYNKEGLKTYHENSRGDWEKWEYNKEGLKTHYEESGGDWEKWTYNKKGLETYHENSDGKWDETEYNEKGQKTQWRSSDEYDVKWEYNEKGLEIGWVDSTGFWNKYKYNEDGLKTHWECSDGSESTREYTDSILTNFISEDMSWDDKDIISFTDKNARVYMENY